MLDMVLKAYGKPNALAPAYPADAEYVVVVRNNFDEYSHTFSCETSAMDYAEDRGDTYNVTVARVIAKTVAVTRYILQRV